MSIIGANRVNAEVISRQLGVAAHDHPVTFRIRAWEGLADGITRNLMRPALAAQMKAKLDESIDLFGRPLGVDRAVLHDRLPQLTTEALETTVNELSADALSRYAGQITERHVASRMADAPEPAPLRSLVPNDQVKAAFEKLQHRLAVAEHAYVGSLERHHAGFENERELEAFRSFRKRDIDPQRIMRHEIGVNADEELSNDQAMHLLDQPVRDQTKALAHLQLADASVGDVERHYRECMRLATNPNTAAEAEMMLHDESSGPIATSVAQAILRVATDPEMLTLAHMELTEADGENFVLHARAARDVTQNQDMRKFIDLHLARKGDGDVIERLRNAATSSEELIEAEALLELALRGDGDVDARLKRAAGLSAADTALHERVQAEIGKRLFARTGE